ncbi:MAG: flagellar brake protein [Lachnospiraceae bacterium]|nr:flagellar brake protein [Lachnospiraceae bacterium]
MSHLLETGTRLELQKIRHIDKTEDISFISRFLYQKSADEAVIEMPVKEGILVPLEPGEAFRVSFYTNKGVYRCQSQVVSRYYEDKLPVAVIKFRSGFEKLQRRQYYRMECILQMEFREITEAELEQMCSEKNGGIRMSAKEEGAATELFFAGVTIDISGGGLRFNSEHAAAEGSVIALRIASLAQDTKNPQLLFARILKVAPVQNHAGVFEHRAMFTAMTNSERESIIQYIFREERKRRKREAGIE